jgi:hypothetical protein
LREFQERAIRLVRGEVDYTELSITQQLKDEYRTAPPIHRRIYNRMNAVSHPLTPKVGQRVEYLVLDSHGTTEGVLTECYDPSKDKIDYMYYYDRKIRKLAENFLRVVFGREQSKYIFGPIQRAIVEMNPEKTIHRYFGTSARSGTTMPHHDSDFNIFGDGSFRTKPKPTTNETASSMHSMYEYVSVGESEHKRSQYRQRRVQELTSDRVRRRQGRMDQYFR